MTQSADSRYEYWRSYVLHTHGVTLESLLPLRTYPFQDPRGSALVGWYGEVGSVRAADGRRGFVVIEPASDQGRGWSELSFAATAADAVRECLTAHAS